MPITEQLGLGPRTGVGGPAEQTSFLRSSWTGYNVTCHSTVARPRFEAQLSTLATPVLSQAEFCPSQSQPTGSKPITIPTARGTHYVPRASTKLMSFGAPQLSAVLSTGSYSQDPDFQSPVMPPCPMGTTHCWKLPELSPHRRARTGWSKALAQALAKGQQPVGSGLVWPRQQVKPFT